MSWTKGYFGRQKLSLQETLKADKRKRELEKKLEKEIKKLDNN